VPSVLGLNHVVATDDLRARGFRVVDVRVHGPHPPGTVVSQLPAQGTRLSRGSWVRIDVASDSSAIPTSVPGVAMEPGDYAIAELRSLGLKVRVRYISKYPIHGVVVAQTTPGSPIPPNGIYIAVSR
jgi:beta-lactam-binding protein with PASTA domain